MIHLRPVARWRPRLAVLLCALGGLASPPPATAQPAPSGAAPAVVVLPIELPLVLLQPAIREGFPMENDREAEWTAGRPLLDGSAVRYQAYFFRGPSRLAVEDGDLVLRFDELQYGLRVEITRPSGKTVTGSCGYGDNIFYFLSYFFKIKKQYHSVIKLDYRHHTPFIG